MAYSKNTWKARVGTGLNRFVDQNGNYLYLTPSPESVEETGTPFSAEWMNNIENGIHQLDTLFGNFSRVNSIYISYDHVSPASLFGGTWERIQDAFLLGVGESGTIGETGGESTHVLTLNEIPSHRHSSRSLGATDSTAGYQVMRSETFSQQSDTVSYTAYAGGGEAHNNMPPYVNVSIWRRVA